jgi:hypothetical protein
MWARLVGILLFLTGGIVCARSANDSVTGLESCFHAARLVDAICSKLDSEQRLDCFEKARAAELECLEHVLSETPGGSAPGNPSHTSRSGPPSSSPKVSSEGASPKETGRTGSPEMSVESAPAKESHSPPNAVDQTKPGQSGSSESATGVIRSDVSPKTTAVPTRPNWVVSETTSPIDYSPLATAVIRSTSEMKNAPNTLAIRCLGNHTELLIRTDGAWGTTRGNELHVDYQINDEPAVGLQWTLSADGKTATYKDDPVGLLQSLSDGARLKIKVADRASSHEAMFQLDGWDVIRKKIATTCRWTRSAGKTSSDKR